MNKKSFFDRNTRPIEHYLHDNRFLSVMMDVFHAVRQARNKDDLDLVSFHKKKLGKQSTTFTNSQRLWVWDKPKYRLFVGNNKGICLEIDEGVSAEEARKAMKDYVKDMEIAIHVDDYFQKVSKKETR